MKQINRKDDQENRALFKTPTKVPKSNDELSILIPFTASPSPETHTPKSPITRMEYKGTLSIKQFLIKRT